MKKIYVRPELEFVSFNFEAITEGTPSPTPAVPPLLQNPADSMGDGLSGKDLNSIVPSLAPEETKYAGTKYYGVNYTDTFN